LQRSNPPDHSITSSARTRNDSGIVRPKAKQAGLPPQPQQSFAVPRRAINLIEALRRSIAEEKKKGPATSRKASAVPARKRA
jgi:hypothetical protein